MIRRCLGMILLLLAWGSSAEGALPPDAVIQLIEKAPAHVQLEVLKLRPGAGPADLCQVTFSVRRIFLDRTRTLRRNQSIELALYCTRPPRADEEAPAAMPGAMTWIEQSALHPGAFLEAYLFREGRDWSLKMGTLVWPIDRLTDKPVQ
jgi:hypothetical protein